MGLGPKENHLYCGYCPRTAGLERVVTGELRGLKAILRQVVRRGFPSTYPGQNVLTRKPDEASEYPTIRPEPNP